MIEWMVESDPIGRVWVEYETTSNYASCLKLILIHNYLLFTIFGWDKWLNK